MGDYWLNFHYRYRSASL